MRERLTAGLLGTALGDALGAPFEGRRRIRPEDVEAWCAAEEPLRWTDDTHMAIALGRSLLATGAEVDHQHLGDAFAAAYEQEPWRGYGAGPPMVFALARRGHGYLEAAASLFDGQGSFGNGAAMRCAPVVIAGGGDLDTVARLAAEQARVTHAHPEAVDGAVVVAVGLASLAGAAADEDSALHALRTAAGYARTEVMTDALATVLVAHEQGSALPAARRLGTGVAARESVPAAFAAFLAGSASFQAVVTGAVGLGGDTDTIAAMAGALAGGHLGTGGLPQRLLERLEQREVLEELARALADVAGRTG